MLLVAFISLKKASLTSQEILFEKLNMRCFNRESGILDALFLIIGKYFQLTVSTWSPTPIIAHLVPVFEG